MKFIPQPIGSKRFLITLLYLLVLTLFGIFCFEMNDNFFRLVSLTQYQRIFLSSLLDDYAFVWLLPIVLSVAIHFKMSKAYTTTIIGLILLFFYYYYVLKIGESQDPGYFVIEFMMFVVPLAVFTPVIAIPARYIFRTPPLVRRSLYVLPFLILCIILTRAVFAVKPLYSTIPLPEKVNYCLQFDRASGKVTMRDSCFLAIVRLEKEYSVCSQMPPTDHVYSKHQNCVRFLTIILAEEQNISDDHCESLTQYDSYFRDMCYHGLAVYQRNDQLCDKIAEEDYKRKCVTAVKNRKK